MPALVGNITSSAINKFHRKISGKGAIRAGKWFMLFILNKDIKIIKSLENSSVLTDGVTETVKREVKKTGNVNFFFKNSMYSSRSIKKNQR